MHPFFSLSVVSKTVEGQVAVERHDIENII